MAIYIKIISGGEERGGMTVKGGLQRTLPYYNRLGPIARQFDPSRVADWSEGADCGGVSEVDKLYLVLLDGLNELDNNDHCSLPNSYWSRDSGC